MYSVMIDLETMSTCSEAAIVAIGAVRFNTSGLVEGDEFYRVVNLHSSQRSGGKIEAETIMWWLTQPEEVRLEITRDNTLHLETVLKEFNTWLREKPLAEVWGNGSDFDNVILKNAYKRLGWTPPWTYDMNRCYRTLAAHYPEVAKVPHEGKHHALKDAKAQAKHLLEIWRNIQ